MLDVENFFNLGTDFFSFTNKKCKFDLEVETDINSALSQNTLVVSLLDEPIHYSFSSNKGLCTTTEFGSIKKSNLLGRLISLPSNRAKPLLQFFEENGYLFNIGNTEPSRVDFKQLTQIIYRMKATIQLMTKLEDVTPEYDSILELTLFLLLSTPVSMQLSDKQVYNSYRNPIFTSLNSINNSYGNNSDYTTIDGEDYYLVTDMIYPKEYKLRTDEYDDVSNGETFMYSYPGIADPLYKKLTIAYKNGIHISKQQKLTIEFLFHFMHENGVIHNVTYDGGIQFYGDGALELNDRMKKALIIVARSTLSQEINYNVSKIKAIYNPRTLAPTWKAPNLLTALYFSLFYMKPNSEIYRKCANPSCTNFFLVKTSNSRKIYCCNKCRNASNQRDYRFRQKK